jgi:hypothetical protein
MQGLHRECRGQAQATQGPRSRPLDAKADTAEVFTLRVCVNSGCCRVTSVGLPVINLQLQLSLDTGTPSSAARFLAASPL